MDRGSQVVGRGSRVVGRGFQVVGRGSQVVGRGFQVVGRGSQVVGRGLLIGRDLVSAKTVFRDPFDFKTNSFKSTTTNNTRFLSVIPGKPILFFIQWTKTRRFV